jgi:serine/threonine protein kinase
MGAGGGGARAAGTLCYMAPEHLDSIHTLSSEKSDIYSFAIVIWVILTAREPFESECCSFSLQRPVGVIVIGCDFSHIQWIPKVLGQWQFCCCFGSSPALWIWSDTMTMRLKCRLSALIWGYFHAYCNASRWWKERRTKMQGGKCLSFFNWTNWTLHKITMKRKRNSSARWTNTKQKLNTHNQNGENRLPKYDSQSEITNDTCLWLRTILGQTHRNITT